MIGKHIEHLRNVLTILSQHNNDLRVSEFTAVNTQVELLCNHRKSPELIAHMTIHTQGNGGTTFHYHYYYYKELSSQNVGWLKSFKICCQKQRT